MGNFLDSTRDSYSQIARAYADNIFDELKDKPLDRALFAFLGARQRFSRVR